MSAAGTSTRSPISAVSAALVGTALVALFVTGSIFDWQISQALVNPDSLFATLGAGYGAWPFCLGLEVAGLLLVLYANWERRSRAIVQVAVGGCVAAAGAAITIVYPLTYLPWSPVLVVLTNTAVVLAVAWGTVILARGVERRDAVSVAVVIIIVIVVELLVARVLKGIWERPRAWVLLEQPSLEFSPWWRLGSPEKAALIAGGVDRDGFRSFPSAHTANAMTLILLTALGTLKGQWNRALPWLFWVGVLWTALVGLSRIIAGAHFVTDVTAGCAVTFVTVLIVYWAVFQRGALAGPLDRWLRDGP